MEFACKFLLSLLMQLSFSYSTAQDASGSGLIGPPLDDATNCPSFSQMSYEISVPETFLEGNISRPGLGFLSVSCSCSNTTELMYTLIMGEDLVPFAIDLTTGALSVTDDLDFETTPSYNFTVVCLVPNNLLLNDTATVTVNLLPVNEHRPTIDSQEVITMITEFTTPGLLRSTLPGVAYIVTDEDQPSENLFYTLRDGAGAGLFFNETDGGMYLVEPFDPDAAAVNGSDDCTDIISHFSFRITVCDLDPPSDLCPTVLLQFVQLYSNDNEPTFTEEELSVDVGESTPVNTTLATVTCTDMDVCEGTLSGMEIADENMTSQFSIDSTGTIRNLQAFDFEDTQAREFNISVRCFDSGIFSQTRESFGTVRLQILDENDNAPTCSDSLVTTNITAGTHSSTKLPLQLLCEDRDEGLNSLLTFTLNQQHPSLSNGQFIVDPRTGNLSFTGELPNIDNVYTLYVTITDSGSPRMSTSVEVRVRVLTTPEPVLPMFVVIVIAVIGGLLLLLCLLLTCLCLCWLCGCSCCSRRTVKKTLQTAIESQSELYQEPSTPNDCPEVRLYIVENSEDTERAEADLSLEDGQLSPSSSSCKSFNLQGEYVISNTTVTVQDLSSLGVLDTPAEKSPKAEEKPPVNAEKESLVISNTDMSQL